ncbi:MAG TPA: DsbA family oxidoreductase [Dehalococcoidia bacterium]
MESWSVGYEGDDDVERHSGMHDARPEKPALHVTLVSDYICPWCYVGLARLEQLREEFEITLSACAFDLRPGIPPEGIAREEASRGRTYPPGYIENLHQTALDAGIEMKRPSLVPNTRKAHEATEFARDNGGDLWAVHRALFRAYFEEEQNIGDADVIVGVCEGVGIDSGALREALDAGRYREEIEKQMEWGRANGVTGVPTTIFNSRFAVVGAQDVALFRDVAGRIVRGEVEAK